MKKIKTFTKCLFSAFLLDCLAFVGCDFSDDSSDSGGSGNSTGQHVFQQFGEKQCNGKSLKEIFAVVRAINLFFHLKRNQFNCVRVYLQKLNHFYYPKSNLCNACITSKKLIFFTKFSNIFERIQIQYFFSKSLRKMKLSFSKNAFITFGSFLKVFL